MHPASSMCSSAVVTVLAAALTGCGNPPVAPTAREPESERQGAVAAPGRLEVNGCEAFEVEVKGKDRITVEDGAVCPDGLRLRLDGEPTYSRTDDGRVTLPLSVVNGSPTDVALPGAVILPRDSITVLHSPGLGRAGRKGVTAVEPDSVLPLDDEAFPGAALWRVGESGVLPSGESTDARNLVLRVDDGVIRFRLGFVVTAQVADTSRPEIPENTFDFPDDTVAFPLTPPDSLTRYYRTVMGVRFKQEVSGAAIREFLTRFGAQIIAGTENIRAHILRFPDPGPTEADWNGLLDRINAELVVELAFPIAQFRKIGLNTRYPSDGLGMGRADWFAESAETWALRAIRAPMAWGCATGLYGEPAVRIGVADLLFDDEHPDLQGSVARIIKPLADKLRPDSSLLSPTRFTHGTMVVGALTAAGDNRTSAAGVMWHTDAVLYAFADGLASTVDPLLYFVDQVLPDAVRRDVRVLVIATRIPYRPPEELLLIEEGLRRFAQSGGLFVIAGGNVSNPPTTLEEFLASPPRTVAALVAAGRLLQGPLAGHVIIVGGVEQDGSGGVRRWSGDLGDGSTFIAGGMDIAAPAEEVLVLQHRALGADVRIDEGTSIAAPMVAGVAAQLWAMEPTLTAPEVKDYINRGARAPRFRTETGRVEAPDEVPGMPGVYLLDAYGALNLLSRERPGTPICGLPVTTAGSDIVIERDTTLTRGAVERLTLPGTALAFPSVARGGRRIAVSDLDSEGVKVVSHTGTLLQTLDDIQRRQYLETDTADVRIVGFAPGSSEIRLRILREGAPDTPFRDVVREAAPPVSPSFMLSDQVQVSDDGRWVAVSGDYITVVDDSTELETFGASLFRLDTGERRVVEQYSCTNFEPCERFFFTFDVAWRHDSRGVVWSFPEDLDSNDDVFDTSLRVSTLGSAGATQVFINGIDVEWVGLTAGDLLLHTLEEVDNSFSCRRVVRSAATLSTVLTSQVTDCADADITLNNLRALASASDRPDRTARRLRWRDWLTAELHGSPGDGR